MRHAFIIVLLCLWLCWAYRAYDRGDTNEAAGFVIAGVALTAYRLRRAG